MFCLIYTGNKSGDNVATPARHYELHDVSYSLPATVLRGTEGYIKVLNTGAKDILWDDGELLLRAEYCESKLLFTDS